VPHAVVRILHPEPADGAGELERLLATARSLLANELAARFAMAGADDVRVDRGRPDGRTFGERLRALAAELEPGAGLVVLGSGSIPLVTDLELGGLVAVAASGERRALTNNYYSADVVAVGDAAVLDGLPDLRTDNALPRWLDGAGIPVDGMPGRDRLAVDLDSPIDLEIVRRSGACPKPLADLARSMAHRLARAAEAFDELAALARDPKRELLVAGRLSGGTIVDLEARTACRIRAFVEERGLRTAARGQRPAASALGMLLDRDGSDEIGMLVGRLADGALVDTRVLLAHRHGADETDWPAAEDRYASDLLLADRVRDPWLQQLTLHAWSHETPIALGGHTLVGPGLALALGLS
jgi:hypothetical protein